MGTARRRAFAGLLGSLSTFLSVIRLLLFSTREAWAVGFGVGWPETRLYCLAVSGPALCRIIGTRPNVTSEASIERSLAASRHCWSSA